MPVFCCATALNRLKSFIAALMLSMLISACGSGSGDSPAPTVPLENNTSLVNTPAVNNPTVNSPVVNNTVVIEPITALINVARSDAWVCTLGDGDFGAYSFFADSAGLYEDLTANGDDTFAITDAFNFTYTTTGANGVQILYEFDDGTTLMENISAISFSDNVNFTAVSDIEDNIVCSRREFIPDTTDASSRAIVSSALVNSYR